MMVEMSKMERVHIKFNSVSSEHLYYFILRVQNKGVYHSVTRVVFDNLFDKSVVTKNVNIYYKYYVNIY